MTLVALIPVAAAAALALSTIAARETEKRIHPLRLELARRGEGLLRQDGVQSDVRSNVEFMLGTAFGMRWTLLAMFPALPIIAALIPFSRRLRQSIASPIDWSGVPSEYRELDALHTSIMMANNPVLLPLAFVWTAIWAVPVLMLVRLFDSTSPTAADAGAVARILEQRSHPVTALA